MCIEQHANDNTHRYEYIDGQVYAMVGVSHNYNILTKPVLIRKMLSLLTANIDHHVKIVILSKIPTLQERVLLEQDLWQYGLLQDG